MAQQHKMYGTPTYKSWAEMKYRCGNPKRLDYFNISYNNSWSDFRIFLKEMGIRPKNTTLDRIDGSKGYSKENCRWATNGQQAENRKSTHYFEFNRQRLMLKDWAKLLKIKRSTLAQRIYVYGWSIEKALKGKGGI
jgi:hypothetical protein